MVGDSQGHGKSCCEDGGTLPDARTTGLLHRKLIPIISGVNSSGAWTEQEGALLTINELLKSITQERRDPRELGKPVQARVVDDIQGALADRERVTTTFRVGERGLRLSRLPKGVASSLKPALYRCLQHDQLSIRQTAAECLLACASLCEESMRLAIFQETISKLNRIPDGIIERREDESRDPSLLDAFEAEGLLDVLSKIATEQTPEFLVKHWKFIFPTLDRYVIHVASSVRQRSSAVILSLAKLSLSCSLERSVSPTSHASADAAVSLLTQMLLSLSLEFGTESTLCWQKREGRLLSVDVLANFLGQDIVRHECGSCHSSSRSGAALSTDGDDEYRWAHGQLATATWTVDSAEDTSCHCRQSCTSITRRIDLWITQNASSQDLPRTSALFWQQVCRGWLAQVEAGFSSAQFELQRISKQALPGLMRLIIWLEQLEIVQSALFEKNPASSGAWRWLSGKYLLLHLRYLHECNYALGKDAAAVKLTKDEDTVWEAGVRMLQSGADDSGDVEGIVVKVEVLSMMFAHYTPTRKPPESLLEILDTVLLHVHAALPPTFQVAGIATSHVGGARYSNTLDRHFCTSLIRMLPAVTVRLTDQFPSVARLHIPSGVDAQKLRLSSCERWLALERIALAWLSSDDMMRWICVPKATGHFRLLRSLSLLMQKPPETMTRHEIRAEFDRIVRCTSSVFAVDQPGAASRAVVADILLSMWSKWSEEEDLPVDDFVVSLAGIYASAQSAALTKKNSANVDGSASESWDDWDDEETRPVSVIVDAGACSTETRVDGLREALARMGESVAARLLTAARMTLARVDARKPHHQQLQLLVQHIQEGLAQR